MVVIGERVASRLWSGDYLAKLESQQLFREYDAAPDPNFLFLDQTLHRDIRPRKRKDLTFFTVRSWRQNVRDLQMRAMRNLKRSPSDFVARHIAQEIAEAALMITNGAPYECVCPVPAGSSGKVNNFSTIISSYVAQKLELPLCRALEGSVVRRSYSVSSHPRQSQYFRSRLVDDNVRGKFCLLVDDVATTGTHFKRCVDQLHKLEAPVLCVSWVS